jgi:hypothetical protein
MDSNLHQPKPFEGSHKTVFVGFLFLLGTIGIAGAIWFFATWRHGDQKAQALSGFLAFLAALVSSGVTIFYIYLTNKSLRTAQESIELQRSQLDQTKSALDLQQREWDQKVRVLPQFWITAEGEAGWYIPDSENPNSNRVSSLRFVRAFKSTFGTIASSRFLSNQFVCKGRTSV